MIRSGIPLKGVIWDWGDTLMRTFPDQEGPMAEWPEVEAMPGAAEALEALSAVGVQCIATNAGDSDGSMVAAALDRAGLAGHLARFFTSKEMGVQKPDPAFFETVSKSLEAEPSEFLAVGNDLRKDILPAKAIGMTTVLVAADLPVTPGDPSQPPDYTFSDLHDFATMVRAGLFDRRDREG